MENTVNSRVLLLKKELGLTDIQFCGRANISTSTLNKIRNNEQTNQKIINSIIDGLNVNREWMLHGKGKMLNEVKIQAQAGSEQGPYKDALVAELKQTNERLIKQNEWFQNLVNQLTAGLKPNFRKAIEKAAAYPYLFPNKKGAVSIAKA